MEITTKAELKRCLEKVTYIPSFYDNATLYAEGLIMWTEHKIRAAIGANVQIGRLLINSVINQILIETGISQLIWPLFIIYNTKFLNEFTVLDNFYIYQRHTVKTGPGATDSQWVKYYPLLNDKDERKWNMNFQMLKLLILWLNVMKDEILYLTNQDHKAIFKFFDEEVVKALILNHEQTIDQLEKSNQHKGGADSKKFLKG